MDVGERPVPIRPAAHGYARGRDGRVRQELEERSGASAIAPKPDAKLKLGPHWNLS